MYTDIWDLIGLYSVRQKGHQVGADPVYAQLVDSHERIYIRDPLHGLEGYCHMQTTRKNGTDFILWVPDRRMFRIGTQFMQRPLSKVSECNYNHYKLYLNILAYISKKQVGQLMVIQVGLQNYVHQVDYRPEVVERLLHDFEINHQTLPPEAITASKLTTLAKGKTSKKR